MNKKRRKRRIIIIRRFADRLLIHYGGLYSASSGLHHISAADPCTAKNNGFQARVECVRVTHGKQSLRQRKSIPYGRANH